MRIFCELRGIFPSNEQNVRSYYMLNNRIRGLLFHYKKKKCYFAIGVYISLRVFRNILIPSVRMTLTTSKMFARIICQTIEWDVNYSTTKKKCYFGFSFLVWAYKTSYSSAIVAPFAFAGIRPVVNRLNQDTTAYYGLVFCAFSWPYMVKWRNSGIINSINFPSWVFKNKLKVIPK